MKTNIICRVLDHKWRPISPRDWCVCHRCGIHERHEDLTGEQIAPTIPYLVRNWIWNHIQWPLEHCWTQGWLYHLRRKYFACKQCGFVECRSKDCDGIPF